MAQVAAEFYGNPTLGLPLIGITGTNGKTTTTYLIEAILAAAGMPAAVLGTISYRFGTTQIEASHTTPESTELQAAFRRLADAGAKAFVMEVSSHALEQKRVDGCHFDVGIFSNLTRDHLDYHKTMESYLESKQRLFSELLRPTAEKPGAAPRSIWTTRTALSLPGRRPARSSPTASNSEVTCRRSTSRHRLTA